MRLALFIACRLLASFASYDEKCGINEIIDQNVPLDPRRKILTHGEASVAINITERDRGLDEFMPNRKDVRNPKTEYLLQEFEYIVKGEMTLSDGQSYGFVSKLNDLQQDILSILEVPLECYTYEYLFDTS